jgi:hypothetical protein
MPGSLEQYTSNAYVAVVHQGRSGLERDWIEMSCSRSLVHGVEELRLDRSRDGVGQSRECDSSRESVWDGSSGSDNGKSRLSSFFFLSLLLGLMLLVANSLGHDIREEFEVVYTGDCTG